MIKNIFDKFFVSLIGKILGFLKIIVLINYYGTSYFTDSLIIVLSIYWFWSNIIVYSLFSVSLIPSLSNTTNNKGQISITLRTLQSVNLISILGVVDNIPSKSRAKVPEFPKFKVKFFLANNDPKPFP